jgi:NAD(P)-dependent dehydrogenase (short-subunit alcohol dehydrogenase family)
MSSLADTEKRSRRYPLATGRFAGRRALITGGATGLGLAAAERLAIEGAAVGLIDRDADALERAAQWLREAGHDVTTFAADVTDAQRIREFVEAFRRAGAIDVLVTMAGIYPWVPFAEMTLERWREVIDINLGGTFVCAHAVMPTMKEQRYGRIVTVSSGTVLLGMPDQSAYIASKAGVIGFTRVLAREGGPFGITANCILPGLIATDHVLSMREDVDAFFSMVTAQQSIQRRGEPADIADAVAYLAGEGAEFVTGQSLSVGGGDRFI